MASIEPAETRLCAEALTEEAHEEAFKRGGEYWMDHCDYLYETFPDTELGCKHALAWCRHHDLNGEGRLYRERLRPNWRRYKRQYIYEESGECCEVAAVQ